jgi:hypothetical protein
MSIPDSLYRIYIDDSGNVDLIANNDPNVRYGSITAVVLKAEYLDKTFNSSFQLLVDKHFGKGTEEKPRTVHRRVLNSPPDHGPHSVLKDENKRRLWDADCLRMYEVADYVVISACVDKIEWYHHYPTWEGDFYEVLVQAVLERAFYYLRFRGKAEVNIETKNPSRDLRIKEHYRKALVDGFQHISAEKLQKVLTSRELNILKKGDAKPGVQLADLLAGPALQHIRFENTGRHPILSDFTQKIAAILEKKFYCETKDGNTTVYGKLWRPAK